MDPVTVAGLASTALDISGLLGLMIQGLHSLKGRFQDADNTIRLLISQLSTIKAAVSQIHDWAEFNSDNSPQGTEFIQGLKIALEGCLAAVDLLSKEVKNLTVTSTPLDSLPSQSGIEVQTGNVWDDVAMREHQSMLSGQAQAWQLLLAASQW
jgi:hypothetical protein